jgi:hypothetical protein
MLTPSLVPPGPLRPSLASSTCKMQITNNPRHQTQDETTAVSPVSLLCSILQVLASSSSTSSFQSRVKSISILSGPGNPQTGTYRLIRISTFQSRTNYHLVGIKVAGFKATTNTVCTVRMGAHSHLLIPSQSTGIAKV